MSDQTTTRGQRAVDAYLAGMASRNELIPGAREVLAKRFAASNKHGGIKALVSFLEHGDGLGHGSRYYNPEREPGRPEAPLRKLVRRLTPAFTSAKAADDFYEDVAIRFTPEEIDRHPERVVEDLWDIAQDSFEHRSKLIDPPALAHRQARIVAALDVLGDHLPAHFDRERFAERNKDIADDGRALAECIRIVAARLAHQGVIARPLEPAEVGAVARSAAADAQARTAAVAPSFREEFAKMGGYEPL